MLKLKYLYENYDLVKFALENWEYDADTLDDHLRHFRISSNAVYPFLCQGKIQFLRLSPASEKLENNLKGELEFLCYLKKRNYPAVIPVASNSGELVVTLDSVWGSYYASVFKGVDGISIEDTDCNDQILFIYGETLGQLHMLSSEYYPKIRKWTYRDVLFWIQKVLEEYHAPDKMLAELEDVRQALDALMENIPEDRQADAKDTFLRGYQSVKTLEHDYTENLKLMRRFCNLYSYARLIRCVAEQYPNEPDWLIGLREKLHRKIKLLENIKRGAYDY